MATYDVDPKVISNALVAAFDDVVSMSGKTLVAGAVTDSINPPCVVVMPPEMSDIEWSGTGITGPMTFDVLLLLDTSGDLRQRGEAMLDWFWPGLLALAGAIRLGKPGNVSAGRITGARSELAGSSPVYENLPYDAVRYTVAVGIASDFAVTP